MSKLLEGVRGDIDQQRIIDASRYSPQASLAARMRAVIVLAHVQGVRAGSGEGGWRLDVKIRHGAKTLEGLAVAEAVVEAWRRHLQGWG